MNKEEGEELLLLVVRTTGNVVQLMQQAAVRNHPVKTATELAARFAAAS